MKFYRLSATENKFLFVSEDDLQSMPQRLVTLGRPELARQACQHFGSGADGFVFVRRLDGNTEVDFAWDFYNNDGSRAEMCGNAARCMAYFVKNYLAFDKAQIRFQTLAGVVLALQGPEGSFRVRMPEHKILQWQVQQKLGDGDLVYSLLNTGVPHAVVQLEGLEQAKMMAIVKELRFKSSFGPAGANVSFYSRDYDSIRGVTFERGVEGFTASCGTGVVAMALEMFTKNTTDKVSIKSTEIQTPGGLLRVDLDPTGKFCWLIGPAQLDEIIDVY